VDPGNGVKPGFSVKQDAVVSGVPAHQQLFYKWTIEKCWTCQKISADMTGEIVSTEPSIVTGTPPNAVPGTLTNKVQVFLSNPDRSPRSPMPPVVGEATYTVNVIGSSLSTSMNSNEDFNIATKDIAPSNDAPSNDTFLDTLSRDKPISNTMVLGDHEGGEKELTMSLTESSSSFSGAKFRSEVTIKGKVQNNDCLDADNNQLNDNTGLVCGSQAISEAPIADTCGLSIVYGIPVNYGELIPGQDSAEQSITFQNDGNSKTPAKVMIKGGDWVADGLVGDQKQVISGPDVTRFSISPGNYDSKFPVSKDAKELGQLSGGESSDVFLQFKAWNNPPIGSFHQDVIIDLLC
jgi:hypothetical protein